MTAQKGLFIGCLCFFQRIPTDEFVLADKSTIRFPELLRNTEAKNTEAKNTEAKNTEAKSLLSTHTSEFIEHPHF